MEDRIVGVRHRLHNTDRSVREQNATLEGLSQQLNVFLQGRSSAFGPRALQQNSGAMEVRLEGIDVDGVGHYL